ncbi:uroporphyrinogen-III synthase [Litchfieldia alkalitelluris]|uniref:uroporphyrinogen-III synthase n=1 Tax=Litchfieldia alkalitelluris TaxID=304268 RepID=UPI000996C86E|nr:uroporphyrinogen-III synthase [Litchfieldia alkalitelluris]
MNHNLPLLGKKILVTRGKDQAKEFSLKIKELGGTPVEVPLISFQYPSKLEKIKETIKRLDTYDWLIFTSENGVEFFFEALGHQSVLPKIAVIGSKTNEALSQKGFQADLIPSDFVAESLTQAFKPLLKEGERFLLARGNLSRSHIPNELKELGGVVDDLVIYENSMNTSEKEKLIYLLKENQVDVLTFTSPSTVTNFIKLLEGQPWREWIDDKVIAAIGPITKSALQEAGILVQVCPTTYTTDTMLQELVLLYQT